MRADGRSGQAAVETIGLVAIVALLLAGAGAWIATRIDPPAASPLPAADRIWQGLDRLPAQPAPVPDLGLTPRPKERGSPIVGLLRRGGAALKATGRLVAIGAGAFVGGFGSATLATVREFVRDPVGSLTAGSGLVGQIVRDPVGFTAEQVQAAIDYAQELKALPADEAVRRFMRDVGEVTSDVVVARGKQAARKAVLRALKRRVDRLTEAPTPTSPPSKRDGD